MRCPLCRHRLGFVGPLAGATRARPLPCARCGTRLAWGRRRGLAKLADWAMLLPFFVAIGRVFDAPSWRSVAQLVALVLLGAALDALLVPLEPVREP